MGEFGSLHYTGCLAGEGLLGIAGMQFRAVSDGVQPDLMGAVERHCLYEPPPEWMAQPRPAASYPRSLSHVVDHGFATASGVYLGGEATGSRQGNHHTHAVVTEDAATFGQVRPAQLWKAPLWSTRWDGPTSCPPIAGDPEVGPFQPLWLHAWVGEQPEGEAKLIDVLSALQNARAGGRRVLFVASDPEPVLAWIAAATLLMPRAEALRVGFKVFVANAEYTTHDAVAVHPDWGAAYRGAPSGSGFVVFDLENDARSPVEPSAAARFWVPRFLRDDCFDVLDAVELSGLLQALEPARDAASRVAASVLRLGEPLEPAHATDVVDLISAAGARLDDLVMVELVGRVLREPVEPGHLETLRKVVAVRAGTPAGAVLGWQVFARTLSDVVGGAVPVPGDAAAAAAAIESAVAGVPPEAMAQALTLAARHRLEPDKGRITEPLRRLVRWWADSAVTLPEADSWSCGALVIDMLRMELEDRVRRAPTAEWTRGIGDLWWRRLLPTISDPSSPLDAALATAALRHGDGAARSWVRATIVTSVRHNTGTAALAAAWAVLHADHPPTLGDVSTLLAATGLPPTHEIGRNIEDLLTVRAQPDRASVAVLDRLGELGYVPRSAALRGWLKSSRAATDIVAAVAAWPEGIDGVTESDVQAMARPIDALPVGILQSRAHDLVTALRRPHPRAAAELVLSVDPAHHRILLARLREVIGSVADERAAATLFLVAVGLAEPPDDVRDSLAAYHRRHLGTEIQKVAALLAKDEQKAWWELGFTEPSRWRRLLQLKRPRSGGAPRP